MSEIPEKAVGWLEEERCPHCKRHNGRPLDCRRKVTKTHYGWRCHGFRSKYDTEPWK